MPGPDWGDPTKVSKLVKSGAIAPMLAAVPAPSKRSAGKPRSAPVERISIAALGSLFSGMSAQVALSSFHSIKGVQTPPRTRPIKSVDRLVGRRMTDDIGASPRSSRASIGRLADRSYGLPHNRERVWSGRGVLGA